MRNSRQNYIQNVEFLKQFNQIRQQEKLLNMLNSMPLHKEQVYYLLLPAFPTSASPFTPFFAPTLSPHASFYKNVEQPANPQQATERNVKVPGQDDEAMAGEDDSKPNLKAIKQKKDMPQKQEYDPRERSWKGRAKKVYEKDKQRNILPNALSKLFFFLKSMSKSKNLLSRVLASDEKLGKYVTLAKFYSYHRLMRSKMERFLTEESLGYLFILADPQLILFSMKEQLAIITVNAILVRIFIKNSMYLPSLLNTSRSPKNKIKSYISKYRRIGNIAQIKIERARMLYDFSAIKEQKNP